MYIAYEEQGDPMRIADEQDKKRKEENNTYQLGASTTRGWLAMVVCAQGKIWSELGGITPEIQCLVSEDLATGGIRAHLVSAKGNGDPWIAGKIKDVIEDFGYGGALVRIKSDQEPAIVDIQRAVIAKRGNVFTILVNSPVGDSQSNGRVENAIKKVRNMVKTILSSLESRWTTQSILGCLCGLLTRRPDTHTWEIWERQQFN